MPAATEDPTKLQCDELMLEYLLWHSSSSLLAERCLRSSCKSASECAAARETADAAIRLVHSFYQHFKHLHPHLTLPEPLALRLRASRFTALLLRRVDITSPTLAPPTTSANRARRWLARRNAPHVLDPALFDATPFPSSEPAQGPATLRDVLWEFFLLSTHTSAVHDDVSRMWMDTALSFMQQALLEAYLCYGVKGPEAADECFAYGLVEAHPDDSIEDIVINEMFAGDTGNTGKEFEMLKQEALRDFIPSRGQAAELQAHFNELRERMPWERFEQDIADGYLLAVLQTLSIPVLAQLEEGRLEGFKDDDVRSMLVDAGVGAELWAH